jgi:hypothetical protein
MAEILVKAVDATNVDSEKDRTGCYKAGMPVVVMPDKHPWGKEEGLPKFVVIKIPGISVDKVEDFIRPQYEDSPSLNGEYMTYRRRKWQIQLSNLPKNAKNILRDKGVLVIKSGTYTGSYDYTWAQVRSYFMNLKKNMTFSENL